MEDEGRPGQKAGPSWQHTKLESGWEWISGHEKSHGFPSMFLDGYLWSAMGKHKAVVNIN